MAIKSRNVYVCNECGYESVKWYGRCPSCSAWNSMVEEVKEVSQNKSASLSSQNSVLQTKPVLLNDISHSEDTRYLTGIKELDRVLGGGIVKGSLVLVGGDPGIGKSTLLLQLCSNIGYNMKVLYVSGEESGRQIKLRASRLNVDCDNIFIMTETDMESITDTIRQEKPELVIIDSIQTMSLSQISSSPGSITQVRECTNLLMRTAKSLNIPIFVVSHVNKDGAIAGPKVLEHIVDCVLYFEGDRGHHFRILRSVKNRFGATDEIGVFEMTDKGLSEVANPSALFLADRQGHISGNCVFAGIEGSRPLLVEIQALVAPMAGTAPRRAVVGWDTNRLNMLLAVLEARCGVSLATKDIFLNVAGGLKLTEPAVDLAAIMAVLSNAFNHPLPSDMVFFGEIGLSGEVRNVPAFDLRIKETKKLGFTKALVPLNKSKKSDFKTTEIGNLKTVLEFFEKGR